jgi:hypothetical protein
MRKDLGNYTDNLDQYIQDVMLLLDQTLTSLEKQRVLAQATQVGDDSHLQQVPMFPVPGNE